MRWTQLVPNSHVKNRVPSGSRLKAVAYQEYLSNGTENIFVYMYFYYKFIAC